MAWQEDMAGPAAATDRGSWPEALTDELFGLIRSSHIFGSAVRELLEVKPLERAGADGLSLAQLRLLQLINVDGRHPIGQVAECLGMSPPAATRSIDRLEELGLVRRTPSDRDRRATLLCSSAKGRRLLERYRAREIELLEPALAALSGEELEQLAGLLERFSTALLGGFREIGGPCLRCSAHFDESCPIRSLQDGCPYQKLAAGGPEEAGRVEN